MSCTITSPDLSRSLVVTANDAWGPTRQGFLRTAECRFLQLQSSVSCAASGIISWLRPLSGLENSGRPSAELCYLLALSTLAPGILESITKDLLRWGKITPDSFSTLTVSLPLPVSPSQTFLSREVLTLPPEVKLCCFPIKTLSAWSSALPH